MESFANYNMFEHVNDEYKVEEEIIQILLNESDCTIVQIALLLFNVINAFVHHLEHVLTRYLARAAFSWGHSYFKRNLRNTIHTIFVSLCAPECHTF